MIVVSVILSTEGVIAELVAAGHAGMALKGADIVCSAFTVLLRTFSRTIEASKEVEWVVRENRPGQFHLVVQGVGPGATEQYRGWCEFFLRGLEDLKGEAPRAVQIEYGRHSGRLFHGS